MSVEIDSQSFWQWFVGVLGFSAGGYKVVTHEMRLRQLEEHRKDIVDPQLRNLGEDLSGIDKKLDGVADVVNSVRDILMKKGAE